MTNWRKGVTITSSSVFQPSITNLNAATFSYYADGWKMTIMKLNKSTNKSLFFTKNEYMMQSKCSKYQQND